MKRKNAQLTALFVHRSAVNPAQGWLVAGQSRFFCALGRSGIRSIKREGDGFTPRARLPLRRLFYRADRLARPCAPLPARIIQPTDAWCDDSRDRRYNRLIDRPEGSAEESLMRADGLYDVIIELGWNDAPVRRNHGSAIFWHVTRPGFTPTAGCVAVRRADFAKILPRLSRNCVMIIR